MSHLRRLRVGRRTMLAALLVVLAAGGALALSRPAGRCLIVRWSSMDGLADGVFSEPGFPAEEQARLLSLVGTARGSIAAFFGECRARPTIICCRTTECFANYSGSHAPYSLVQRTPLGDFIVIGPKGLSELFVTHELVHCELDARLGWWRSTRRVPMWFHEGVALVVTDDRRYDETAWRQAVEKLGRKPQRIEIESAAGFNALTAINSRLSYGAAWHEVAPWFARAGREGLSRLLDDLNAGGDFEVLYCDASRSGTSASVAPAP